MSRALYVSAFIPDARAPHAGGQAAHTNLSRLRERHDQVDAIVCTTEPVAHSPVFHIVRQTRGEFLRATLRYLGTSVARSLAASIVHSRLNEAFIDRIRGQIQRTSPDLLFCDFTQAHLAGILAVEQSAHRPELHLCVHDVFAQRCLRSSSTFERLMCGWVMREEWRLAEKANTVVALCDKDADLLRSLYLARDVQVNAFRPPDWVRRVKPEVRIAGRVLYFANFDREENREGATWFVQDCAPEVRQRHAGFHLVLGGNGSDRMLQELGQRDWMSCTGYVDDPAEAFSQAAVCIAPLGQGAGVKFKVLEALAARVPVLATPIAAEGVEADALLTVASRESYGDALVRML